MPDLPAGRQLKILGQGVQDIGAALSGMVRQRAAASDSFYKARAAFDASINAYFANLSQNPDHSKYVETFEKDIPNIIKEIEDSIKLPEAKTKFQEYYLEQTDQYRAKVRELAQDRLEVEGRAGALTYSSDLARLGKPDELQKYVTDPTISLYFTAEDNKAMEGLYQEAKKQKAKNDLSGLTINEQIQLSNDPTWQKQQGLGDKEAKELTDSLLYQKKNNKDLLDEDIKKRQDGLVTQFLTGITDKTISKETAEAIYTGLRGHTFQDNVRSWIDKTVTEEKRLADLQVTYGQQGVYGSMRIDIESWGGKGKEPWGLKDLDEAFANKEIDQTQFNLLVTAYTQKLDDIRTGKAAGPNYDDPTKVMELWKMAWNVDGQYKDTEAIHDAMSRTKYLGSGCSGEKWSEIWNKVDEFKGDDTRKRYVKEIGTAYSFILQQMIKNDKSAEAIKRTSSEEGIVTQQMINFMNDHPGDTKAWDMERDRILGGKAVQEAMAQMMDAVKARWPSFASYVTGYGPQFTEESKLETLRTWAAENKVTLGVAEKGAIEAARPAAINQELTFLKDNGVKNVIDYKPDSRGEMNYVTADGNQYKVVQQPVGGVARFVLYKVVDSKWVKQNWK
jgi:hypothetical protein